MYLGHSGPATTIRNDKDSLGNGPILSGGSLAGAPCLEDSCWGLEIFENTFFEFWIFDFFVGGGNRKISFLRP